MQNIEVIQNSIDYIEKNLKSEVTAEELAKKSGFSLFHYYRIFQGVIGIPVMQYVLIRKLRNAIYEISRGEKMIDVGLAYGFETHAGFFKAFKREYDCSPTQYLKKHTVKKPYKIKLNQEEHIMITHKRIKEMLLNWNISDAIVSDIHYEGSGLKSENTWFVNDNWVIKVGTNLSRLKSHIEISKALSKAGLEVAVPILTTSGMDYILDGDLYFCLTNRLQGKRISSGECYEGDFEAKARYLGEIIGELHIELQKHDKDIICNEPNLYESIKDWGVPEVKRYMTLPISFYSDYIEGFKVLYPCLPKHIIHRDPNPSNIIVKDGKLTGFIDFELCERNIRIFDICYAATAILSESFAENDHIKLQKWLSIFKNIVTGYNNVCRLTDEEKQAIPYVIYTIQIICIAYFSDKEKFTELAKVNQKMLSWLYDNKDMLIINY
jgi:Ser/Thr protein kinase RdoA (MazF antagonist)/AraC-like DNA-binding protein